MTDNAKREWGCLTCEHMFLDTGWCGTEATPGDKSSTGCSKGHWEFGWYDKRTDFVETMKMARTCKDYDHDL